MKIAQKTKLKLNFRFVLVFLHLHFCQCKERTHDVDSIVYPQGERAKHAYDRPDPKLQRLKQDLLENSSDKQRIVNGEEVDPPGKYAFMVRGGGGCGGSLIAPNVVLTAAHCAGYVSVIQLGRHDLNDGSEPFESFSIDKQIKHPSYNSGTLDYDFMMIKLSGASSYTPVTLDDGSSNTSEGEDLIVMGWGATYSNGPTTSKLMQVEVDVIANPRCRNLYGTTISDRMLCAGRTVSDTTYDACQGDSGGPIINKADGKLVGVVSWGYGCANPNYPGVYARVSNQIDWINGILSNWGDCTSDADCTDGGTCQIASCQSGACKYESDPTNSVEMSIEIKTDKYPGETTWYFKDTSSSKQVFSGGPYTEQYTLYTDTKGMCHGNYIFTMKDSYGDGICCVEGDGYYKVYVGGTETLSGGPFKYEESKPITVASLVPSPPTTSNAPTPAPTSQCNPNIQKEVKVKIKTDNWAQETSWEIIPEGSSSAVMSGGNYFQSNNVYTSTQDLSVCSYTFKIHDSYGDGVCCSEGDGSYKVFVDDIKVLSGGQFGDEDIKTFQVTGAPTVSPPTNPPTLSPTIQPTSPPTNPPTFPPTKQPTEQPTPAPTDAKLVCSSSTKKQVTVEIVTDIYPAETSWEITPEESPSTVVMSGGNYETSLFTYTSNQDLSVCTYIFQINDSYNDGMCCNYGNGSYKVIIDGAVVVSGAQFTNEESKAFDVAGSPPVNNCNSAETKEVQVDILTDNYPAETSWEVIPDSSSIAVMNGGSYTDANTLYTDTKDLSVCSYTFKIKDSYGDGICCSFSNGYYKVSVGGTQVLTGGEFDKEKSSTFEVTAVTPVSECNFGATKTVTVKIVSDSYPAETSWEVATVESSPNVVMNGGSYAAANTPYEVSEDLYACDYTFKIKDSYSDGMCCNYGNGSYKVLIDGTQVLEGGQFTNEESKSFTVTAVTDKNGKKRKNGRNASISKKTKKG